MFELSYKLNPGERFVAIVRKHWFLIAPKLFEYFIIIALLLIFVKKFVPFRWSMVIIPLIFGSYLLYFFYCWILWQTDYYILTSERIIKITQKGVLSRTMNEIAVANISNAVSNIKGVTATLLGFGTIKIFLKNGEVFSLKNIIEPIKIYQAIIKLKEISETEQ